MLKRFGLAAAFMLLASSAVFAQTATISGRVVDDAGAVLPGATITVTNTATGAVRETVSNEEGLYNVPALIPGIYNVRAALTGFAAQGRDNVEVLVGANMAVELKLGIAALQENITVSGQAPLVESTQAVLASSIRQQEVAQLPMMNRSISALITMLPGAREVPATVSAKGQSVSWVSVGGGGGQNVVMVVDGVDNKEDHCGGASLAYSLDGIQEFQVFKTGAQAEYGRGTAAVLVATKSGTNRFSGSAFGFYRNDSTVANDYFSKPENGGSGEPPFLRTQLGGSFGGPLVRDKAWFFGAFEHIVQDIERPRPQAVKRELDLLVPLNIGVLASPTLPQPARDTLLQGKVNFNSGTDHSYFVRYAGQYGYLDNTFGGSGSAMLDYAPRLDRNGQDLLNAVGRLVVDHEPLGRQPVHRAVPDLDAQQRVSGLSACGGLSDPEARVPDRVDRTGVGRRLPELVQLRGQVAVPERHVHPDRTPRVEVRRRLRVPAEARRDLRARQPGQHQLLPRSRRSS